MPNPHPKNPTPSIEEKTLKVHINEWCAKNEIDKSYDDFVELMESPIEPKIPNVMRIFGLKRREPAKKWIAIYKGNKS
jgi:hypothetical protein